MKMQQTAKREKKDDSLFGLLSLYKQNSTYFRVLVSEEKEVLSLQIAANPSAWKNIPGQTYAGWRQLRRLELGCEKISIKYLLPEHIVRVLGPSLGAKIPDEKFTVTNSLDDKGYYIIDTSLKNQGKILSGMKKIISLTPHKKYEIIEKYLLEGQV